MKEREKMGEEVVQVSESCGLLRYLAEVRDPRRAQGRIYPLWGLLGMLVLAAVDREQSLRGMWLWARAHWEEFGPRLGLRPERKPQYGTLWHVLSRVSGEEVVEALQQWWTAWGPKGRVLSIDGKVLRENKQRSGQQGIETIVAALQETGAAIREVIEGAEDPIEAALAILEGLPLEGYTATANPGLHPSASVQRVLEKEGLSKGGEK